MTSPVSLLPPLAGAFLPPANPVALSDDEQRLVTGLSTKLSMLTPEMLLRNAYYNGTQRLTNLGISVPQQLAGVRTVVDWPRGCIDPVVARCGLDGFRMPKSTDVDDELAQHWQANDMDAELPVCLLDSMIYGRGWVIVGSPDKPGDSPVITVESPLNLAATWDPRTRAVTAAYQAYEVEGVFRAVLYLPDVTISMSRDQQRNDWRIDNRDEHKFGEVPVVPFRNRARSGQWEGVSEITAAIMSTTDSACRSLLGMEIAREFYSIPHRYVLGANEDAFLDAQGNKKTALDMAMNKFLGLERDDAGQLPQVGQFEAFDPSVFTKIIDEHAQLMSSYTGFPPSYFGQTTTANPASADAIRTALDGLVTRAFMEIRQAASPTQRVGRLVWRFANGGKPVTDEVRRLVTDWNDPSPVTPLATSQALTMQSGAGMIPPASDVTLKKAGWTAIERDRLEQDRAADEAQQIETELAKSLEARLARTDKAIASDLGAPTTAPVLPGAPPVVPPKPTGPPPTAAAAQRP